MNRAAHQLRCLVGITSEGDGDSGTHLAPGLGGVPVVVLHLRTGQVRLTVAFGASATDGATEPVPGGFRHVDAELPSFGQTHPDTVVEADERGRVSLGRAGVRPNQRYVAHAEPDGTVILTPAAVVTYVARFLQNTRLVEQIEDNRAYPGG
jgi:hypothetical protein